MATFQTKQDYYVPTDYFKPTQPNPTENSRFYKSTKDDCVVRAFCIAAGISWLEAFDILVAKARETYNVPNDKACYAAVFEDMGYKMFTTNAVKGRKRLTAEAFAKQFPKGRYILSVANHITAVVDGKVCDTWNCGNKCVYKFWIVEK